MNDTTKDQGRIDYAELDTHDETSCWICVFLEHADSFPTTRTCYSVVEASDESEAYNAGIDAYNARTVDGSNEALSNWYVAPLTGPTTPFQQQIREFYLRVHGTVLD
jgi:hypothetical protein